MQQETFILIYTVAFLVRYFCLWLNIFLNITFLTARLFVVYRYGYSLCTFMDIHCLPLWIFTVYLYGYSLCTIMDIHFVPLWIYTVYHYGYSLCSFVDIHCVPSWILISHSLTIHKNIPSEVVLYLRCHLRACPSRIRHLTKIFLKW